MKFFEMIRNISNPNLQNDYSNEIRNLRKKYTQNRTNFENQFRDKLITLDNLTAEVSELNKKLNESIDNLEGMYEKYNYIQIELEKSLKTFDIEAFNEGKPIIPTTHKEHKFIITKGYITDLGIIAEQSGYTYYYKPEFKSIFDKLLGKTKIDEKTK